jgi:hypothetical protein
MPFRLKMLLVLLGVLTWALSGLTPLRAEDPVLGYSNPWPAMDGFPYYGQNIPYHWVDITNGTRILTYDGEYFSSPQSVGFSFPFYGQSYTTFYINANGFITFSPPDAQIDYAVPQCPLPDSAAPNNLIALLWGDLGIRDQRAPVDIYYKTFGTCPVGPPEAGACLIVEYLNAHFEITREKAGTFEAILYQNGDIVLQYSDVGPTLGLGSNSYTIGIENNDYSLGYGLTYICDAPYALTGGTALKFVRNFLHLSPETLSVKSCNGQVANYTLSLTNATGAAGNFALTCQTSTPGATITCPASVYADNKGTVPVPVTLTPPACAPPGFQINGTVSAVSGNGYTGLAVLQQTLFQSGIWDQVPPEPEYCRQDTVAGVYGGKIWSIAGKGDDKVRIYDPAARQWTEVSNINKVNNVSLNNFARSGCQHGSKVYFYGDADPNNVTDNPNFSGLWSFDMSTNPPTVKKETASGGPPISGIFGPAWAYDPEEGLCYLTGGAQSPDPPNQNSRATVYVYNPKNDSWQSSLTNFTTSRKLHAAFVFRRPGDGPKLLCVAGGLNTYFASNTPLASTQCYDLTAGNFLKAENADLGPLPVSRWGMGYTQRLNGGTQPQLWLVGGVLPSDQLSPSTLYFDANGSGWRDGGNLISGKVYRNSVVAVNNDEIFKLGGLVELSQVCSADRYAVCSACGWWTDQIFLPLISR